MNYYRLIYKLIPKKNIDYSRNFKVRLSSLTQKMTEVHEITRNQVFRFRYKSRTHDFRDPQVSFHEKE